MAEVDRRSLLGVITGALGALAAGVVALPVVRAVIAPFKKTTVTGPGELVAVAKLDAVPEDGTPVKVPVVVDAPRDGWTVLPPTEIGAVYLRRVKDGEVLAYSTVCPHLGCGVDFVADKKTFACPCHESAFDLEGKVAGGPSPRGLDRLETRVEDGRVQVRYVRFKQGTGDKVPA